MEISTVVWAAMIAAISSIVVSVMGLLAARRKNSADAVSVLTGAALKMVTDIQDDCENLRIQIRTLQEIERALSESIRKLENELADTKKALEDTVRTLEIAELNIAFLLEYMQKNGLDIPDLKYRGGE